MKWPHYAVEVEVTTAVRDSENISIVLVGDSKIIINSARDENISMTSFGHLIQYAKFIAEAF